MLFQLPVSALLLAFAVLSEASHGRGAHLAHMRRRELNPRKPQPLADLPTRSLSRRSCKKSSSSSTLASSTKPATIANVAPAPSATTTEDASPATSTKKATPTTTKASSSSPTTKAGSSSPNNAGAAGFEPTKPSNWPTATQSGLQPSSTVASAHDPYLEELSKAIDYTHYDVFTQVHTGDMTWYGQGLGACGDVYDDSSFTAAVSMLMFDKWPGASAEQNRNPICGPFVPGRQIINSQGLMASAVKSSIDGHALIGGDGLINCAGTPTSPVQCHVPLTATVTHGDKSIQVRIVDRCVGCQVGDIDLTPAAFIALTGSKDVGRTSVSWKFNSW